MWTTNFLCGQNRKYQNYERVFPASIPLLNPNQPRHTFPCVKTQLKAIKRGSRVFRKTLTKQEDFLTDAKVERWREKVRDQTLTKEEIKKVYLLTNSNLLHAPQKDALLRVITNKTLFNNQIPNAFPTLPEWFTSINCKYCEKHGVINTEDFHHATSDCLIWDKLLTTLSTLAKTTNLTLPTLMRWPGIMHAAACTTPELTPTHAETIKIVIVLLFIQVITNRRQINPPTENEICLNILKQLHTISLKPRPVPLVLYLRETVGLGKRGLLTRPPEIY